MTNVPRNALSEALEDLTDIIDPRGASHAPCTYFLDGILAALEHSKDPAKLERLVLETLQDLADDGDPHAIRARAYIGMRLNKSGRLAA